MPIYEYECEVCQNRTEILQKISDPPLAECPKCKGSVRKVISPAGLHFKGSGFYITDYAKKNEKSSSETKNVGKTEGKIDGKTDGKKKKSESTTKKESTTQSDKTSKDK